MKNFIENCLPQLNTTDEISISKKEIIQSIGKALSLLFSFACGITNVSALFMLNLVPGAAVYPLASILFIAVVSMNYKMLYSAVPDVLIDIFGEEKFLYGLIKTEDGTQLPNSKKIMMLFGFLFALAAGLISFALNLNSIFILLSSATISANLANLILPISIFFASIALVCITSLSFKSIVKLIKMPDFTLQCKNFIYNLWDIDPTLLRNREKSRSRIISERILNIILIFTLVPLAAIGLFMTTTTCSNELNAVLLRYFYLAPDIANSISNIISFNIAMVGQIPFTFRTAFLTINNLFEPQTTNHSVPTTVLDKFHSFNIFLLRIIFAVGNGFISMLGAERNLQALALSGGIFNSIASTVDDSNQKTPAASSISLQKQEIEEVEMEITESTSSANRPHSSPQLWVKSTPYPSNVAILNRQGQFAVDHAPSPAHLTELPVATDTFLPASNQS